MQDPSNSPASDHPRPVRVRIAPSPTGYTHVGTARTALFNWLYARHHDGTFVLRVEDTDRSRFVPGAYEDLVAGLRWLGIEPDEGPEQGGEFGPYRQTQRLELYREHADRLLESGAAYRCFCPPERLEEVRTARMAAGQKVGYDRRCRDLDPAVADARAGAGEPHVVRLKMPLEGAVELQDRIRGPIAFDAGELEDVVLLKSDAHPTYHLAVVVDDHLMEISHVLRADEWIPSAPVQVQLYRSFGWSEPVWVHLPLVLNPGGQGKLSKRRQEPSGEDDPAILTQVREYRAAGYLPEALVNFLALLGWAYSGDEEVFTMEEAVARFDLADVRPAPSAWDPDKLAWMNGIYMRALDPEDLALRMLPFLLEAGLPATPDQAARLAPLVRERLDVLADAPKWLALFWATDVDPAAEDLVPKGMDATGAAAVLERASLALEAVEPWRAEELEIALRGLAEASDLKASATFHPVRVAVTGSRVSPPLFETLEIVGRDATLARIDAARERLGPAGGAP